MEFLENLLNTGPTFSFNVGQYDIAPTYITAGLIVFLLFLLVLTLARLRHMYISWSLTGAPAWMLMGVILTLILEGFLLISGKTVLTEVFGWKNAPSPIQNVLDSGRNQLIGALGVEVKCEE